MRSDALLSLTFLLVLAPSCGVDHPCGPCLPATIDLSTVSGEVAIATTGRTGSWELGNEDLPCRFSPGDTFARNADEAVPIPLSIACEFPDGENLWIDLRAADVRQLEVGTHQASTDETDLWIKYQASTETPACYTHLPGWQYQVVVSDAAGGAAPHPAIVTPDFARDFEIAIDLDLAALDAKQYTASGEVLPCELTLSASLHAAARVIAAAYNPQPTEACVCE